MPGIEGLHHNTVAVYKAVYKKDLMNVPLWGGAVVFHRVEKVIHDGK